MRKELEAFIEESFAGLPPSPETEQAKAQVRKQLEANAAVYRAKGMAPWAADQHAMMRFGAVAGARESVARLRRRAIRAECDVERAWEQVRHRKVLQMMM